MRTPLVLPLFLVLALLGCSAKKREYAPLPDPPLPQKGREEAHPTEQELEWRAVGEEETEAEKARRLAAFRFLKREERRGATPVGAMVPQQGSIPRRKYQALSRQELGTLKTSLAPCVRAPTLVWVQIDPKGRGRLAAGQTLATQVLPCLVTTLRQIAFFEGVWRKGVVHLP